MSDRPPLPQGVVAFAAEHAGIHGTLQSSKVILETLVGRLSKNEAEVDNDTIIRWKSEIVDLVRAICMAQYKDREIDSILNDTLTMCMDHDYSKILSINEADLTEEVLRKLDQRSETVDVLQADKTAKSLIATCTAKTTADDEDLYVEDDSGLTEAKTKCPYSAATFKSPLKNKHPQRPCIHHVDQDSLNDMERKRKQDCPVAGCSGCWSSQYTEVDDDFKMKIERFFRMKKRTASQATASAVEVEDD